MTKFTKTLIASIVTFSSAGSFAAAFQLAENSTSGLGMAFAGAAATADDATVVATNPALMTKFKQVEISAGGILVDTDIDIDGKLKNGIDASQKNIVPNIIIPNAYIVAPVNDRFVIGGGVNVNYGLKSEFSPNYSAGFFGGRTELSAVNLNLSGAYNLGYGFSIGAGIDAVHAKATLERRLGLIGKGAALQAQQKALQAKAAAQEAGLAAQKLAANGQLTQAKAAGEKAQQLAQLATQAGNLARTYASLEESEMLHKLKGDKWAFGWNAGLLYEINENHRLGFAYHSQIKLNFNGKYSNTLPITIPGVVDTITGGASIPGQLSLILPAYWEISGYHKLTDKFAVNYSYKRTDWSKFKSLNAYGSDNNPLFAKHENFNDASRIAIGASYDVNEKLTLRSGISFDESASTVSPSISIPDTDRTWYSVGATVRFTQNFSADLGYSHLRGSKNTFNEDGLAEFKVKSKANLYGLNLNYKF
ncbi:hypothetical protein A6B43_00780 [Vespertiliibacter pulmonis]|uniref:Long-chain fatty acid transport protein n=1 Tax=Vespertiliibacter pulmonis TaxID=1443036 RepID=A0A3N4W9D1_9PAST|nr:outer membrane protein transport protein [Vespertiliibacter pulmonis]QLB20175.1 hypothetical protein A6B43_00780 [Vespertiliibacter pulmonis]RPE86147.1 long-chain fatty acid transport protein [Vespertiliibacter pulmonis]